MYNTHIATLYCQPHGHKQYSNLRCYTSKCLININLDIHSYLSIYTLTVDYLHIFKYVQAKRSLILG